MSLVLAVGVATVVYLFVELPLLNRQSLDRNTAFLHTAAEDEEDLEDYRPGGYHPVNIGDEFSQNTGRKQVPLVLDEAVLGVSRYFGDHGRLYGQYGYAFNTAKETNADERTRFDWGLTYENYYDTGPAGRPYAAYDMDIRSYQSYTPNNSLQVGWQWVGHGRSVRLAVQVFSGKSLFGQFYTNNERWVGFGGYYDF